MKRLAIGLFLLFVFGVISYPAFGNPRRITLSNQRVVIREKVVNYGELLKVIAVPVTETDAEYYFEKASKVHISDDDAKKIAEFVIKLLEEKLATDETTNELEQKVADLVNNNCLDCHNNDKRGGDLSFVGTDGSLTLSDTNGKLTEAEIAFLMYSQSFDQKMPKGKDPLSDEDVSLLKQYTLFKTKNK